MAFINLSQLTKAVKGLVNKINSENYIISSKVGDLSDLDTTDKSNLVAAINEAMDSGGVSDYTQLTNKPSINSTTLTGNKTAADLGLVSATGDAYRAISIPIGQLDSTSTATVMTATVDGITELRDGVCMWLRNDVVTGASNLRLNVNGLGAKMCISSTSGYEVASDFKRGYTFLMIYNSTRRSGGCWDVVYGYDVPYSLNKLGFLYGVCTTAAENTNKQVNVGSFTRTNEGIVVVKFNNDVPAGATLTIVASGVATTAAEIYYRDAVITDGVIKAGDTVTMMFSTYYRIISIDRDEAGVTMTDEEVDAAVNAAFGQYTITNESPTLVSVQSSASAGETVTVTRIYNGNIALMIGTTSGGDNILHVNNVDELTDNLTFTMPNAPVFVSANAGGGGSND